MYVIYKAQSTFIHRFLFRMDVQRLDEGYAADKNAAFIMRFLCNMRVGTVDDNSTTLTVWNQLLRSARLLYLPDVCVRRVFITIVEDIVLRCWQQTDFGKNVLDAEIAKSFNSLFSNLEDVVQEITFDSGRFNLILVTISHQKKKIILFDFRSNFLRLYSI